MEQTYQNQFRIVWVDPGILTSQKGSFLFASPEEARPAMQEVKSAFPGFAVWVEDRENNMVAF